MRRLYYIHPKIQFPFAGFMAGIVAVELILFALTFLFIEQLSSHFSEDVATYLRYGSLLVLIVFFTAINFLIGTRLSHRLAGPLVQILRALEKAKDGDFSVRTKIRANDYLQELCESVNILMENLEKPQNLTDKKNDDKSEFSQYLPNVD